MRIVLDTNIWVSYFMAQKICTASQYHLQKQLTDTYLINELKEVFNRPKIKKYLNIEIDELIDFHKELCYHHNTSSKYKESPDPKDNFLYDLAIQTKSKYVVTGDKKILATNPIAFKFISKSKFEQIVK